MFQDPAIDGPETEIEYRQVLGDIDPYSYPTTPFGIAKINKALCDFDGHVDIGQLPGPWRICSALCERRRNAGCYAG